MPVLCSVHFEQDFLRLLPVADSIGMKRKLSLMLNRLNTSLDLKKLRMNHLQIVNGGSFVQYSPFVT